MLRKIIGFLALGLAKRGLNSMVEQKGPCCSPCKLGSESY